MSWQWRENMMPLWKKSGNSCNADVSMHNSSRKQLMHNRSTKWVHPIRMQPHLRHQRPNPSKTGRRKESSTGNAVTAAYIDINGWNAGNGCEKKHNLNPPARSKNNHPKPPRTQTIDPNITQSSCIKFAERWDTLPETVTTGTRPRQFTKVFRILNSQRKKTNNSEGTLDKTTTESTQPVSCPTLLTTKLTTMKKWNNTMTRRTQKTSKATSSKSTKQKCAPKSTTTDYYSKTNNNSNLHWLAVPSFNLY